MPFSINLTPISWTASTNIGIHYPKWLCSVTLYKSPTYAFFYKFIKKNKREKKRRKVSNYASLSTALLNNLSCQTRCMAAPKSPFDADIYPYHLPKKEALLEFLQFTVHKLYSTLQTLSQPLGIDFMKHVYRYTMLRAQVILDSPIYTMKHVWSFSNLLCTSYTWLSHINYFPSPRLRYSLVSFKPL